MPNTAEQNSGEFFAAEEKNKILPSTLYLVATPIGNLADISERAIKTLREVDFIAAEDTRNSGKLLRILGIEKPLVSYFEHNKAEKGPQIADRLEAGESCALITDAGTPAISDPGEDLVALCAARGIRITSVPGACAAIDALTLSALPCRRFTFEGFLSANKNERRTALAELRDEKRTMIFHEAPHKLRATLDDMAAAFGEDRRISLCRELTKLNEDVMRVTLGEAIAHYRETDPRGEYVLVVEGSNTVREEDFWQNMTVQEHVTFYMNGGMSKKDAVKACAKDRGVVKNEIYQQVLDN